ncbi:helix-turn-helix domain-containing protein [Streptomyces scopuliridis]|uniref:helix-turn-helix domain-containing protein n=1 Tax=Streptomyces scopuliridis TaxID=452529 RepID=UPI002DD9A8A8|nr:helix-turn-helix domain-containing protein [Streptomyces scopuliridis]WSB33955.1 helix-turn-helix domain-containing protein [Streptomyces scopuliridis]
MTQKATQSTARGAKAGAPSLPAPEQRRRLRESKPMTEKQAAAAVGVTRSTLRSWETGRTAPRGRKGELYAKLLAGIAAELREKAAQEERARVEAARAAAQRSAARNRSASASTRAVRTTRTAGAPTAGAAPPPAPTTAGRRRRANAVPMNAATASTPATSRAARGKATTGASTKGASATGTRTQAASATASAASGTDVRNTDWPNPPAAGIEARTPDEAFDALYAFTAPALVRQAYLLTGRRVLSQRSVERAFHLAWARWPEVAVDRDPAGWLRAAAYEYAMSPWHRLRSPRERPDPVRGEQERPEERALRETLLGLPASYRRTLLLYDGLGLDLPETAAETEASTPATASRLLNARKAVAEQLPELTDTQVLQERLGVLVRAVTPPPNAPAPAIRSGCERRARFWTRAAIAFTVLIVGATGFTLATAPRKYEPPLSPGERVGDLPVTNGPQRLSKQDLALRDKLRHAPVTGPDRLVPQPQ